MKKFDCFSRLFNKQPAPTMTQRIAGGIGVAILLTVAGIASAQNPTPAVPLPTPESKIVVPEGYTIHQSIDLGGHMTNTTGSTAMYDTLVNIQSGPRVLGETFEMRALPTNKHTLIDILKASGNGFGGDPNNFAKLDFSKGRIYEFSGIFRRDRQYFDYDLLGNPNIVPGRSIPIGPLSAPTGSLTWPEVLHSSVMFNTVRRMTDTNLTLFPLSTVTFHVGYSQNIFQGPSLSPGASSNYYAPSVGANDQLLMEYQRNSTDSFMGAIDWKPLKGTKLTFEEQIEHYKGDSYFTLNPDSFLVQEADGTPVSLGNWDSQAPYGLFSCNKSSMAGAPNYTILSAPQTPGGKPIIDPACSVAVSYIRSQPTRVLFPTEILRFQSNSIKNLSMNGDFSYTDANMNLPNYYENFQGLDGAFRSITFTGNAKARREVVAADYGLVWQVTKQFSLTDQIDFSSTHQPGTSNISAGVTSATPTTAGSETLNYSGPLTVGPNLNVEGSANGTPLAGYFGQKFLTNNLTGTWDASSGATFSLTYRFRNHTIAEGIPHNAPLAVGEIDNGTVNINENGAIFNAALRPTNKWDINGSVEVAYADNAFTPIGARQTKHYRVHTMYKPMRWATFTGAFNDMERHNNTNNNQSAVAAGVAYAGPIDHVDYSRIVSLGGVLMPNEHYGLDFNYTYSDVYTATNICYNAGSSPAYPGTASATGTACPGATVRGTTYYEFGPVRDFMDAPTQYGSIAVSMSPVRSVHSNIGYRISSVSGNQFFNDARAVNGSLNSTYQSPYVDLAWTVHHGLIWRAEYNFYGYGEGGPSGPQNCSVSNPTLTTPAPVVPCNSLPAPTGLTEPSSGLTAPRNFHANNLTLALHYEF